MPPSSGPVSENTRAVLQLNNAVLRVAGLLDNRLARAIGPGTPAPAAEPPRAEGGSVGASVVGAAVAGLSKLAGPAAILVSLFGKVAAALAPIALLGVAIGSSTSGFSIFISAVQVLGATLGAVLLPVFVLLSAAVITVADYIWDKLLPVLGEWYEVMMKLGKDAAVVLGAAFDVARDAALAFAGGVQTAVGLIGTIVRTAVVTIEQVVSQIPGVGPALRGALQGLKGAFAGLPGAPGVGNRPGLDLGTRFDEAVKRRREEQAGGGQGGGAQDRFGRAMRDVLGELRFQMGPKAQRMGVAEAGRAAQLAALSISPFEQKMLDRFNKVIQLIEEGWAKAFKPSPTADVRYI